MPTAAKFTASAALLEALPLAAYAIRARQQQAQGERGWQPLPHQKPPDGLDWFLFLLLGGRGSGKTDAAAYYVDREATASVIRIAIIAPTLGDAVEACVNGPSGLRAHNPAVELRGGAGGLHVRWPNGSEAKLFGAHSPEDVERLRAGGNRHLVWAEELAAWRYLDECWQHMRYGLRLGEHPRVVASTTPKPRKLLKQLVNDPRTEVRRATTDDNPYLNAGVRSALYEDYGGTRLGRQELGGELLEDVEGALWQAQWIEQARVTEAPEMVRIVVAVDPAATAEATSDYTGLCVAGLGTDGDYYVLRSMGVRLSPNGWAQKAIDWYDEWQADKVICEVNNGGDMVSSTLRAIRKDLPIKVIHASRGKTVRAEPIATLDEQCVVAGTLIATARGLVPIEQVTTADEVWTRAGLRQVRWAGCTGVRPTVRLRAGSVDLTCTGSHPVHTPDRGFVHAASLVPQNDILSVWNHSLVMTADGQLRGRECAADHVHSSLDGLPTGRRSAPSSSFRGFAITPILPRDIGGPVVITETNCCIALSGHLFTDQSLMAMTSTISTGIMTTTAPRTWSPSTNLPIRRSIHDSRTPRRFGHGCSKLNWNGGGNESLSPTSAKNVTGSFIPLPHGCGSALRPVIQPIGIDSVESGPLCQVYNLEVEGQPEFFANGVLVHNCRVHHVGQFATLEDQMFSFPVASEHDDEVDARVYALTELSEGRIRSYAPIW